MKRRNVLLGGAALLLGPGLLAAAAWDRLDPPLDGPPLHADAT